jgi:hypothetical protein
LFRTAEGIQQRAPAAFGIEIQSQTDADKGSLQTFDPAPAETDIVPAVGS